MDARITIIDGTQKKSLSDYSINRSLFQWNTRNRIVVANIAGYYGKKVGVNGVGASYVDKGIAHYDPSDGGIWIAPNLNGKVSSYLNDKNNLMNVLVHENKHKTDDINGVDGSYESHVNVYLFQTADKSFKETTPDFKKLIIGNLLDYMYGIDDPGKRRTIIENFNDNNSAGYKLDETYSSGYGWGITNDKGQTEYVIPIKPDSHN